MKHGPRADARGYILSPLRGCEEIEDSGMMPFREGQFFLTQLGSEVPAGFIRVDAIRIEEENHVLAIEFAILFLSLYLYSI